MLDEGDVLFIPAFHFHHFESLDPATVSVNVWSNSLECIITTFILNHLSFIDVAFGQLMQDALPFTKDGSIEWKNNVVLLALEYLVPEVISRIMPYTTAKQFLQDLVQNEYHYESFHILLFSLWEIWTNRI